MNDKEVISLISEATEKHNLGGYSAQAAANGWPIILLEKLSSLFNILTEINENLEKSVLNTEICAENLKHISEELKSKDTPQEDMQNILDSMRNHQKVSEAILRELVERREDSGKKQTEIQATPRKTSGRRKRNGNRPDSGSDA